MNNDREKDAALARLLGFTVEQGESGLWWLVQPNGVRWGSHIRESEIWSVAPQYGEDWREVGNLIACLNERGCRLALQQWFDTEVEARFICREEVRCWSVSATGKTIAEAVRNAALKALEELK